MLVPDQGVVVAPVLDAVPGAPSATPYARTAFRGPGRPRHRRPARAARPSPRCSSPRPRRQRRRRHRPAGAQRRLVGADAAPERARRWSPSRRTSTSAQDFWYAHVVEEVVLLEEVGSDGLHRFALGHARDLADLLVAAPPCTPTPPTATGDDVELRRGPRLRGARRARRPARAGLPARRRAGRDPRGRGPVERPDLTGLFTGPLGSWSVCPAPASQRAWARAETVASIGDRARLAARPSTALAAATGVVS